MSHRVDPDALFGFIINRWGHAVAAQVCPKVEPELPAEPVIDEATVKQRARALQAHGPDEYPYGFYLHMAKEELRSNAWDGSSERSSASWSSPTSSGIGGASTTKDNAPAPAADQRLTDGELWEAYLAGWLGNMTPNGLPPELGEQGVARLRAVADAQLKKARVTISVEEIASVVIRPWQIGLMIDLLSSKGVGVEVTP